MKLLFKLLLASIAVLPLAGCSSCSDRPESRPENVANAPSPAISETNAPDTAGADKEPVRMREVYPPADYSQDSPTDAMRTWVMATINRDVPALRGILSAGSMKMFEEAAARQGKSVGEVLTGGAVEKISQKIPEFRNEKISGDTATVEYKDEKMPDFITMPLVKEDGKWKVAYDVFTRDLMKRLTEEMNKPAPRRK